MFCCSKILFVSSCGCETRLWLIFLYLFWFFIFSSFFSFFSYVWYTLTCMHAFCHDGPFLSEDRSLIRKNNKLLRRQIFSVVSAWSRSSASHVPYKGTFFCLCPPDGEKGEVMDTQYFPVLTLFVTLFGFSPLPAGIPLLGITLHAWILIFSIAYSESEPLPNKKLFVIHRFFTGQWLTTKHSQCILVKGEVIFNSFSFTVPYLVFYL